VSDLDQRRAALIEGHLLLVDHVVRRVSASYPSFIDDQELVAAGRLGLTEAAMRYDFDREVPFAPYAARRIRGSVLDLMRSSDWLGRKVRETAREVDRVETSLRHRLGRAPEEHEVAAAAHIEVQELRETHAAVAHGTVGTLERGPLDHGDPIDSLVDPTVMEIPELLEQRELRGYVRSALVSLPERLRLIVVGHYLEGRSVEELAETLGITPSRVSQLRADAIEIIRTGVEAQFRPRDEARPHGRVAIRRAAFASAVATHSDWRARLLSNSYGVATREIEEPLRTAEGVDRHA
jgi:RNA polymerase sigma factor for flagellar operon FliA